MRLIRIAGWIACCLWLAPMAKADVAILLEEPYSYDGALAGTGHAAVYLTRICAASPTELRRCERGELGVVLSRYHRISGHDWIAIPLTSYVYAVETPAEVPLFADAKLVGSLRDAYRRKYLESVAPDGKNGETPGGDWYELVGSAYNRTLYGFQIETTPDQDDAFIAAYNGAPNREAYRLISRNCADFVRNAVNFYYPKAVSRSIVADLGVTTPKHAAKSLVKFSKHHPELRFTAFVIPQVPGTMRRSRPVHGLMESVFKAKKYEVPLLALHPGIAGAFAAAYVAGGRFNPARGALVLAPNGDFETPVSKEERRAYQKGLQEVTKEQKNEDFENEKHAWRQFVAGAKFRLDANGHPTLQRDSGEDVIEVGLARDNFLDDAGSRELSRQLLITRIRQELQNGRAPKVSESELRGDWKLLKSVSSQTADPSARTGATGAAQSGSRD